MSIISTEMKKRFQEKKNNLQIFENEEFGQVRALDINGEPYFVGKDVAEILGYAKPLNAVATHVDEDDSLKQGLADSLGRTQQTIVINESGLYSLILSSKLPTAKKFKRWVTSEVLPSIRKNGMYATDELLDNPDLLIGVATKLKEEREKNKALEEENAQKNQIINELQPKASYYDLILQNNSLVAISVIGKDYGMSGTALNKKLHELGVQYLQGKTWLLYAKYQDKGYTFSKTQNYPRPDGTQGSKMHTYWTQKGRIFIYDLLKQEGILPIIEREE